MTPAEQDAHDILTALDAADAHHQLTQERATMRANYHTKTRRRNRR